MGRCRINQELGASPAPRPVMNNKHGVASRTALFIKRLQEVFVRQHRCRKTGLIKESVLTPGAQDWNEWEIMS